MYEINYMSLICEVVDNYFVNKKDIILYSKLSNLKNHKCIEKQIPCD